MLNAVQQFDALRRRCGVAPCTAGWIDVTGADRVRWLNGMVTNSVQALTPGDGAYNFLLSAQGRIQGDLTAWAESERLLLQTTPPQTETILALLDRFIIMDEVELADVSAEGHGLAVVGPEAVEVLQAIGMKARAARLLKRQTVSWRGESCVLINGFSPLVPRFELWSHDAAVFQELQGALIEQGGAACDAAGMDLLRIAEGTPLYGTDIRDRDLPQETGQARALHFAKGCYLGQEIVERIRSRGNVHRTFMTFAVTGDVPAPGTALEADGKAMGELTSVASHEIDGRRLALGFMRREVIDRGLAITYNGGSAEPATATEAATAAS